MAMFKGTRVYAFVLGFWERLRWSDGFGRTWTEPEYQHLNEVYDCGANVADVVRLDFKK